MKSPRGAVRLLLLLLLLPPAPGLSAQEPGETPLSAAVDRAIEAGAAHLLERFDPARLGAVTRGYPLGSRALVAYALVEAGCERTDPRLKRLFREMQDLPLARVYGVSLYAMALDAWIAARRSLPGEIADDATLPGGGSARAELRRCLDWLVSHRAPGRGSWGYGDPITSRDAWTDHSNTQFAALALHAGQRRGVQVPRTVFEEVLRSFTESGIPSPHVREVLVDRAPWRGESPQRESSAGESPAGERVEGVRLSGRGIGWAYRPLVPEERRKRGSVATRGTVSMTAAAVSSVLVARHGLESAGGLARAARRAVVTLVDGGVIELARSWRPGPAPAGESLHRNHFYTLYSLEKAMDLAGVGLLDGVDWYRDQVPFLLRDQGADGAWGGGAETERDGPIVSTAFALLFLRRATARLGVLDPAPIETHARSEESGSEAQGRVFVEALGGMVDLEELRAGLEEDRTGRWVATARGVFDAVPEPRRIELIPWLLPLLRQETSPAVEALVRESISAWTGLPADAEVGRIESWWAEWSRMSRAGAGEVGAALEEAAALARTTDRGLPLRVAAIRVLRRSGSLSVVPVYLDLMEDPEPHLRELGGRALRSATGGGLPFEAEAEESLRTEQVLAWRDWWLRQEPELRAERVFQRLREDLERARTPDERATARSALIGLGREALPRIDRILQGPAYSFDWVLVRGAISGDPGIP